MISAVILVILVPAIVGGVLGAAVAGFAIYLMER